MSFCAAPRARCSAVTPRRRALNIVTNKPNLDEFSASAEATYGNLYRWPLGRRPDDHAGLSDLGL
ncbi:MAG: hypothetical protein WDM81_08000 [Rhizomicrobium sp.]